MGRYASFARHGSPLLVERTGAPLATCLEIAGDTAARRKGLLGRDRLEPGHALMIAPSQGVHTFGMRFAIDIVAVARDGTVLKTRAHVPPRRVVIAWSAFAIIELPAGTIDRTHLRGGDRVISLKS